MSFNSIAGNTRVKRILKMALQKGRVPNSLLFCGPAGVGKFRMAKELAMALNCLHSGDDSCGECVPCRAIRSGFDDEGKAGAFPDVMAIQPEKAVIKIDQMKFVKQMAYLKPLSGKKRVFIVDQAETMNEEAANSLLKVLEEPPLFTHIILVTSNPFRILPTIRSRCQILSFSPITREEIERILLENGYPSERARVLAPFVDGNLERALNLDWEEIGLAREEAWKLFLSVASPKGGSEFLSSVHPDAEGGRPGGSREDAGNLRLLLPRYPPHPGGRGRTVPAESRLRGGLERGERPLGCRDLAGLP